MCTVLGSAKEWKVNLLFLDDKMGAEGWEVLSKVADKGKVDRVGVSKQTLRTANVQQIEALWQATDGSWLDYNGGISREEIAKKSEGDAGLIKLLAHRNRNRNCRVL